MPFPFSVVYIFEHFSLNILTEKQYLLFVLSNFSDFRVVCNINQQVKKYLWRLFYGFDFFNSCYI